MFTPLDDVAHVIQTALTPAFLLAALAGLLGVFASRLDGVANRVEQLSRQMRTDEQAYTLLRERANAATPPIETS